MILPTGVRGQLTALALLAVVLILVFHFVALPFMDFYRARDDQIFDLRQQVLRYRYQLAERPALEEAANALESNNPLNAVTLPGGNPALAAASLQQRLQELAVENNVRVMSLSVRTPQPDGPLERIALDARVQAEIVGLRNLLFELENAEPFLFFDYFSVHSRSGRRGQMETQNLDVRLGVYGLRMRSSELRRVGG